MTRRVLHIFALLCLIAAGASGQERKIQNKPFLDSRKWHYGFFVGMHDQSIRYINNGYIDPETGDQWFVDCDRQNFGFNVGVLGEWRINKILGLRAQPSLYFGSKHLQFRNAATHHTDSEDMKSCYVGMPIDLKIAAPRFNNYRPYVVTGFSGYYDLTSGKHTNLRTKPVNLFLELGMGIDLYMPFFKFIPELKFCLGLNNLHKKNRPDLLDASKQIFSKSVDSATTSMVVLTFYFE